MKGIIALMFMSLMVLFALCATAMSTVIVEIDGEVMVMSTGPPTQGVLAIGEASTFDPQDRMEVTVLMCFISDDLVVGKNSQAENATEDNTNNERSGLLRWYNSSVTGPAIHRWILA